MMNYTKFGAEQTKFSIHYFDEFFFAFNSLSTFTITVYLIGICIIVPGFTGIIWYEKYGNHRSRYIKLMR